jgi:predicted transposase YbfD/YdcC
MSAVSKAGDFQTFFGRVEDGRLQRKKAHLLIDIMFLSVAATIAGADGPSDIEDFGVQQLAWLQKFVPLENGIPSHDTIGRVLAMVKPLEFQQAFLDWIASFASTTPKDGDPRLVPIDGKTLRGSHGAKGREHPLHLVSAWATTQGLTLGQVAVDSKSNEITAIPELLKMLELRGAIVSIDAMGCQKEIAKGIVQKEADYVLAVKDNQPTLMAALETFFEQRHEQDDFRDYGCRQLSTREGSPRRTVERYYAIAPLPESLQHLKKEWPGLKSIGQVVTMTTCDGEQTSEVRYFISSREPRVQEFANSVRCHWGIESMHWILDVVFGEDHSRLRNGAAAENYSFLRKFVISLLKQDTSKGSLKGKRKRAAWSTDYLESVLF